MRASTIFALLAGSAVVSASLPAPEYPENPEYPEGGEVESTTTLTATTTTTKTITLTSCGPDVPDCVVHVSTLAPEPTTEAAEEPTPTEVEEEEVEEVEEEEEEEEDVTSVFTAPPSDTVTPVPSPNTIITLTSAVDAEPTADESPNTEEEEPVLAGAASVPVQAGLLFGATFLAFFALN